MGYYRPTLQKLMFWLYPPHDFSQGYHFHRVARNNDGMLIPIDTTNWVGWNIFAFGEYSANLANIFRSIVKDGDVVFDVGANIGAMSLTLCKLVGARGQVFAFEPFPAALESLHQARRLNNLSNLQIREFALSNEVGRMQLYSPRPGTGALRGVGKTGLTGMSSLAKPTEEYMRGVDFDVLDVEVKRLDDVVMEANLTSVDFIKIDAEGFDCNVIQGGLNVIKRFRPYVVFEYDLVWHSRSGKTLGDAFEMLDEYSFYKVGPNPAIPLTAVSNPDTVTSGDILAVPLSRP